MALSCSAQRNFSPWAFQFPPNVFGELSGKAAQTSLIRGQRFLPIRLDDLGMPRGFELEHIARDFLIQLDVGVFGETVVA